MMSRSLARIVCIFLLSPSVMAEQVCTDDPKTHKQICIEIGDEGIPQQIIVKGGGGCGTNSACRGNSKVVPGKVEVVTPIQRDLDNHTRIIEDRARTIQAPHY